MSLRLGTYDIPNLTDWDVVALKTALPKLDALLSAYLESEHMNGTEDRNEDV